MEQSILTEIFIHCKLHASCELFTPVCFLHLAHLFIHLNVKPQTGVLCKFVKEIFHSYFNISMGTRGWNANTMSDGWEPSKDMRWLRTFEKTIIACIRDDNLGCEN